MVDAVRPPVTAPAGLDRAPSSPGGRRALLSSTIGSVVEWYSFLSFGTASALVFGPLFFPTTDPLVGTIAALTAFAVGEFARPLGGAVFGHFGDRLGRRSVLMTTMVLMGASTFLIGLLPTFGQIGVAAPVLLAVLRFVQGLAIGGEWGGAMLMAVEHAPSRRRGIWGSLAQLGSSGGLLLSTSVFAVLALLPEDQFQAWGWRVPFLIGIVLAAIGLFIRNRIDETPVFDAARPTRTPLAEVVRSNRWALVLGVGLAVGPLGAHMILIVWVTAYAKQIGYPASATLTALILTSVVQFLVQPLFGALADRLGRRPVYVVGSVLLAGNAFLAFVLIGTGSTALLIVAYLLGTTIFCAMFGQAPAFLAEMFPTGTRYTGISLSYQTGSLIGSGLGPVIAASLLVAAGGGQNTWLASCFIAAICVLSAVCAWVAPETRTVDLRRAA